MDAHFNDRVTGAFPLAISTSLALEGALGIHPENPTDKNILPYYGEIWVNLRTLYRNLHESVPKDVQERLLAGTMVDALLEEIEHFDTTIRERATSPMKIIYYASNYAGLAKRYPKALLRTASTQRQVIYQDIQQKAIKGLLTELGKAGGRTVRVFDLDLKPKNPTEHYGKALMISHYAYDLLSHYEFQKLTLLESHTGVAKDRALWSSKYTDGRQFPMIPFRESLLQVFGDSTLFRAWNVKDRRVIVELAQAKTWTPLTTISKIRQDLRYLNNPMLQKTLNDVLTSER